MLGTLFFYKNKRPCKRVSGGKSGSLPFQGRVREGFPLENLTYEVAKESSEHLNEVKMRALRGNCQKFPLKERNLERRRWFKSSRPDHWSKKGFHPLFAFCFAKLNTPYKECASHGVNPMLGTLFFYKNKRPCKRVSGGKSGSLPFQGRVSEGFPPKTLLSFRLPLQSIIPWENFKFPF